MTTDTDVLVVGGGPVGLAAAVEARLAGWDVVVVEPREGTVDKACGEGLMPGALGLLRRWDVDPAGTFSDSITNNTEISSPDAFDSLGVHLMRDRFIAVARRLSTGAMQIRTYRFSP